MSVETLPEYLTVSQQERGESPGLNFDSYRHLARTALAIIAKESLTMGLYRREHGCGLDIFGHHQCLTIEIDSTANDLSLFVCPMDVPFATRSVC